MGLYINEAPTSLYSNKGKGVGIRRVGSVLKVFVIKILGRNAQCRGYFSKKRKENIKRKETTK